MMRRIPNTAGSDAYVWVKEQICRVRDLAKVSLPVSREPSLMLKNLCGRYTKERSI